jgi:arginine-tRNA-protein transferase
VATEPPQPADSDPASPAEGPVFSHYPAIPSPVKHPLSVVGPTPCPYLPGRSLESRGLWAKHLADATLEAFLDSGFRRSGNVLYQPVCRGCRRCVPLRIGTEGFAPTSAQRRVLRRNRDLEVSADRPRFSEEKLELYQRYLAEQHDRAQSAEPDDLRGFLYESPATTIEMEYRLPGGDLIGVGIVDITPSVVSTVYFFWDPRHARRSLGTFSLLQELLLARQLRRPWYHLGFWVDGSATMDYKASIADHELLGTDGVWRKSDRK